MRGRWKGWAAAALAAALTLGLSIPALAADQKKKVGNVKLKVTCDEPEADQPVGNVTVTVPDTAPYQVDSAEFYDTDDTEWDRGEIPVVRVELSIKDSMSSEYYFANTSKSKFDISGSHSEYKSARVLDGGSGLRVDIKLRRVSGPLDDIDDLYWNNKTAVWDEVDDADEYEVKLYRNDGSINTITTRNSSYDFYPYMTQRGNYAFKVRAISGSDGEKSSWTDQSEYYYVSANNVYTGAPPSSQNQDGSGWVQDRFGWWYRMPDGSRARNRWLYVDNNWFHFNSNGDMETGWIYVDNNWFYLNTISDGTRGAMFTGWNFINGNWYYLNPVSDGTRGALKTGWLDLDGARYYLNASTSGSLGARLTSYEFINGNWYFLDPTTGALWANTYVPNGKWADAGGVIHDGWLNLDGSRYYLGPNADGTMYGKLTSYQFINGNWYFFDLSTGALWVNRPVPNGKWADINGVVH